MATPATTTGEHRPGYGDLLRTPGAWRFLLPGLLARQPIAMLGIGTVLLVEHTTGSYGAAGIVTAISGVAMALLSPQSGKLTDRFGQGAVLVPGVLLHALAVSLLIVLALREAPLWTLFAAAVPAGASTPPISPMVRARWSACLDDTSPLMTTAAAFESVTDEFTFIVGPVLATALCTGVHPAAGLVAEAALILGGGLFFAAQRGTQPRARGRRRGEGRGRGRGRGDRAGVHGTDSARPGTAAGQSALSIPGVRVLIPALLGIGTVFGGMQVSVAAFTQSVGRPEINGVLYGIFAAGNMTAAVAVGAVRWKRSPQARLLIAYPVLVLAALTLAATAQLAPWLALLGTLGLVAGLCVAPSMITSFTLVELLVPAAVRTEAFTWLTGAVALGQAAGSMAAGQLTDGFGADAGFFAPLAGTGLALVALVVFRGWLADRSGGRGSSRGVGHRAPVAVD
ncbi:MAG TPA: MFS transporter [Streptomyces sp.]|nr:MFS transporter [Streptomyces sp.]